MGLPRALVDQARRVYAREDPGQPWREGQPPGEEAFGPWFKCRFRPSSRSEQATPERGGYSYVDETARLLIGKVSADGTPLLDLDDASAFLDADDMVEVQSELGTHRWFVNSAPSPLRRRRGIVGWTVQLRRAREATVQEEPMAPQVAEPARVAAPSGAPVVDPEWAWEGG
jgi:hypothetical protein